MVLHIILVFKVWTEKLPYLVSASVDIRVEDRIKYLKLIAKEVFKWRK